MKATCSFNLEEVEVESLLKIPDSQYEATARRDLNTIRRNDAQGMKKKLKQRQSLLAPCTKLIMVNLQMKHRYCILSLIAPVLIKLPRVEMMKIKSLLQIFTKMKAKMSSWI